MKIIVFLAFALISCRSDIQLEEKRGGAEQGINNIGNESKEQVILEDVKKAESKSQTNDKKANAQNPGGTQPPPAPIIIGAPKLSFLQSDRVQLGWTAPPDASAPLSYFVCIAASEGLVSPENCQKQTVVSGWREEKYSFDVAGLLPGRTYHGRILLRAQDNYIHAQELFSFNTEGSRTTIIDFATENTVVCYINIDHELYCWGRNDSIGQITGNPEDSIITKHTRIGSDADWSQVATGDQRICAIKTNGTLWCWGRNNNGGLGIGSTDHQTTPQQVGLDSNWKLVHTSFNHTCGVKLDGKLYCWGNNANGRLGDGTTSQATSPVQVGVDTDWVFVETGYDFTCGLKADKTLWCWGKGSYGQLGQGNTSSYQSPMQVGADSDWEKISVGGFHGCGIKSAGTLYCWGYNADGQVGNGTFITASTPSQIGTDADWEQTSVGFYYSCGIKNGQLYCWGSNYGGTLGAELPITSEPTYVGHDNVVKLDAHGFNGCALTAEYKLYCWGSNLFGQTGNGTAFQAVEEFKMPFRSQLGAAIVTRYDSGCLIDENKKIRCFGYGENGQLGYNHEKVKFNLDEIVAPDKNFVDLGVGIQHGCALDETQKLYCWGLNSSGQVGDGTTSNVLTPKQIGGDSDWHDIITSQYSNCAIKSSGELYCWGKNNRGQIGDGTTTNVHAPKQVGVDTDWVSGAFIYEHACFIKGEGELYCWGRNNKGQLGDGTTAQKTSPVQVGTDTDWLEVATMEFSTCAIKTSGTLWCWGDNAGGELGNSAGGIETSPIQVGAANHWKKISAGYYSVGAVTTNNEIYSWGANSNGESATGYKGSITEPTLTFYDFEDGDLFQIDRNASFLIKKSGHIYSAGAWTFINTLNDNLAVAP